MTSGVKKKEEKGRKDEREIRRRDRFCSHVHVISVVSVFVVYVQYVHSTVDIKIDEQFMKLDLHCLKMV